MTRSELLHEPLLQFMAFGAVIFLVTQVLAEWRTEADRSIVVDAARVRHLSDMYRAQMGVAPSMQELNHLIDSFVREEMLYREAVSLGIDRDDEIIRRRLAQKMEFLVSDVQEPPQVSEAELRAYHQRHAERFSTRATVTFEHRFFSIDARGDEGAMLAATRALADPDSFVGDRFPLEHEYTRVTEPQIVRVFGETAFTQSVLSERVGRWAGPFRSGYGWHLIFVREREPARLQPFAQVAAQVRAAYLDEQRRSANDERLAALRERYTVIRTP